MISVSSLMMSLKYNPASHVDYFKCFLIVIHSLWIKSENLQCNVHLLLHRAVVLVLASTLVPWSLPRWRSVKGWLFFDHLIMESLPVEFHFLHVISLHLGSYEFPVRIVLSSSSPFFLVWKSHPFFPFQPKTHILHISLSSGRIGCLYSP